MRASARMRLVVLAAPLALGACALHRRPPTPFEQARDEDMSARILRNGLPRFVPVIASGIDSSLIGSGTTCVRTMVDPHDSTFLQLARVLPVGRGDYSVPAGRYGIRPTELLRLHCADGTAAGFVPR